MEKAPMPLTEKGKPDTTARHVLAVLAEYAEPDGTEARPALMKLQYRSGYDRRTIQRALRRLEAAGLIRPEGTKYGCTIYRLAVHSIRPESDWKELEMEEERQKGSDAERQRRSRAKRVTHSNDVTVTDAECVTGPDVTDANDVSHAPSIPTSRILRPDVTDATPPNPSFDPPGILPLSSIAGQLATQRATSAHEREIEATPEKTTAAQATVRASGVVALADEQAFIDWVRAKHPPAGAPFWRRVAENGDMPGLATAWRADQPMRQSAPTTPAAATCWTCTRSAPTPIVAFGHTYCPSCCEPCSRCRTATPADALDIDTNRCPACRAGAAA